ncbi:phosphomannomutase [Propionivibrio sp.]|uniref:phosphomannomutase n=2 Tax=Propionivibrio sp. TaxID=2212460 RepID=UPI0025F630DF|nr:phosphomannomutase [Propionivibrio sp.]MBK7356470.1 phosphomannomutase [Propionivibrio sp.]MBK8744695.1 phosphomannomutase [Propionivibrio sp.]MBK8893753.1 phosphomannomutase [Propionivibrio sp.]
MNHSQKRLAIKELMDASGIRFGTSGVRGPVGEMSRTLCFAYTSAFLNAVSATSGAVALAIDLRPSSPEIAAACAAAIAHAGLEVDYCGAIPTPALALYAQSKGVPGIMVTGSHIPFDRNGIKFYSPTGEITKADENCICQAVVDVPEGGLTSRLPPVNRSASQDYIDRYLRFFPPDCLSGMKLGFYEHSSVARDLLQELLEMLGATVIPLGRVDEFVPIDTEAVSDDDVQLARRWADQHGFDAILSTDGDADRPLIGDERGHWLRGDITGILCAQYLGALAVATTISCNTAVELCGSFLKVLRTRIGSPYVIEGIDQLVESGARNVVGFEPNGGFLVGSRLEKNGRTLAPLLTRDAVLPILCLLSMAREKGCKVSELARELPARFTASDRLQSFPTETSQAMLRELAASPEALAELLAGLCGEPRSLDQTEGLRIYLANDEIVFFRPSGNAPELRCYAESTTQERAGLLVQECLQRMNARLASQRPVHI